jgi:integrase
MTHSEGLKPDQLTADHIWKYRVFLSKYPISDKNNQTLKKKTQNYYLIALRNLLTYFTDRNIQCLPADKIKLAKDKTGQSVKFLPLDQIEKLLLAPDTSHNIGMRDRAILETLFSTGLRVAELVALNRDQVKIKKTTKELELEITGENETLLNPITEVLLGYDDVDYASYLSDHPESCHRTLHGFLPLHKDIMRTPQSKWGFVYCGPQHGSFLYGAIPKCPYLLFHTKNI